MAEHPEPEADERNQEALARKRARLQGLWRSGFDYHVELEPEQVIEALRGVPGVVPALADASTQLRTAPVVPKGKVLMEFARTRFRLTRDDRASGAIAGLSRTLFLDGQIESTPKGSMVRLEFVLRRSRQSRTRALGFGLTSFLGLVWVMMGHGALADRALYFGVFLLVTLPVIFGDRRRAAALDEHAAELLSVTEAALAASIVAGESSPYRTRMLAEKNGES